MLFGWKIEEMQLAYIDERFLKYDEKEPLVTTKVTMRALFYNEAKKMWSSLFVLDERTELDYLLNLTEFNERKWVLLRKNTSQTTDQKYEQHGPYSSKEIFEMIAQSAVRFKDPIWKQGMSKWQAIKDVPTFKALVTFSEPVQLDAAELLENVMEYDPQMHRVEEKIASPGEPGEVFIILDDK